MQELSLKLIGVMLASCLAANPALADAQNKPASPAKPQDFAYAVPLNFEGQDALYQTTLPLSVYQNTVRSDLGDLRVFNAQGEVVPHMLRLAERSSLSQPTFSTLPYFPLHGPANAALDQLSIRVKIDAAGSLIDIGNSAKPAASSMHYGYLVDASALKQPLQALELDWSSGKENTVASLQLESSDDLKHWSTLLRDAPLVRMQFNGHSLSQNRVAFPALRAKYLRLSWPQQPALQLNSIRAELSTSRVDTPLNWLAVKGSAVADKAGDYEFDVGAHLPLQRLRITLPQMNTLAQAAIFSRARSDAPWQAAGNAVLYQLHHAGQELKNQDIAVSNNHRYWLLRIEQTNGGLGSGLPQLQAGWLAHQLQFVTRGSAPFQLAYGSSEIKPAEFQMRQLFPANAPDNPELILQPAQTGAQQILGGEARLNPGAPGLPWKKWILWAVLGIAVLLLGWMAQRLLKQLENHDKNKAE